VSEGAAFETRSAASVAVGSIFRWLTRVESAFAVLALCVSAGALISDILARELFSVGLFGSLRVAVYATALAAFSGFAICVATGSHLRISALDGMVPLRWRSIVMRLGNFGSFCICAYFAYWSYFYVQQTASIGETDSSLQIEVWPIQSILVWMFVSGGLRYLAFGIFPELAPSESEPAQ
jgi:C4-dicarboxylate transporter, DctQ subunit